MSQDQFPHDNWPKDMDRPPRRVGARLVHVIKQPPSAGITLTISPVIDHRHTLTTNQALALVRELVDAVAECEDSPAVRDLELVVQDVCECYGVRDAD